ncbi:MAG: hypothetical protein ABI574_10140 [Burkholderiales bacterium]
MPGLSAVPRATAPMPAFLNMWAVFGGEFSAPAAQRRRARIPRRQPAPENVQRKHAGSVVTGGTQYRASPYGRGDLRIYGNSKSSNTLQLITNKHSVNRHNDDAQESLR